jgi:hypothetical protein
MTTAAIPAATLRHSRTLLAIAIALIGSAVAVQAAEAVYPVGSHLGLIPPGAMEATNKFDGFVDPKSDAAIVITALPPAAYEQLDKSFDPNLLRKQGVTLDKREPVTLKIGKAILFSGRQTADHEHYRKWVLLAATGELTALVTVQVPENDKSYSDLAIRTALESLAVREVVPESEQLSLLPFSVGDLAGFRVQGIVRGRALALTDERPPAEPHPSDKQQSEKDAKPATAAPAAAAPAAHMMIAVLAGGPTEPDDRANFARLAFSEINGIRDARITDAEPLRITGLPGFQTMADAKDARTGADVKVVQWLRFGSGGYLREVGIIPAENWTAALARLRAVRDSIDEK